MHRQCLANRILLDYEKMTKKVTGERLYRVLESELWGSDQSQIMEIKGCSHTVASPESYTRPKLTANR